MRQRPGCLSGILRLAIINAVFDFLQRRFGFGRGASCGGIGCGIILLFIMLMLVCGTCASVDWTRLSF
jgi:hypothetical protein